jgi:hypothetical protein
MPGIDRTADDLWSVEDYYDEWDEMDEDFKQLLRDKADDIAWREKGMSRR